MLIRRNSLLCRLLLRTPASLVSIMSARVGTDYCSFVDVRLTTPLERRLSRSYIKRTR